jgi:UDP-N-acetyl-D-mannosaminuronic acid dehydrogenase
VDSAPNEAKLIRTARLVNDSKPDFVLEKIRQAIEVTGKEKAELTIACLGLAFKPNIDDLRHSPALKIAKQVGLMGFSKLVLVEPNIDEIPHGFDVPTTEFMDLESALLEADLVVLLVDHTLFKEMDLGILSGKQVVDTRGIWSDK